MRSLILNIILFVAEVIGLTWSMVEQNHFLDFKFYTNLSNVLAMFASLLYIIYYFKKNALLNNVMLYLKMISTIGLLITFLTVIFVLGPNGASKNGLKGYLDYLFPHGLLFLHVLCPIIGVISFTKFESNKKLDNKWFYILACLYTFVYGILVITFVYYKQISAPYFFLDSVKMGYLKTFLFGLIFVGFSGFLAYLLVFVNKKIYKESI
jgi:hypothetical protein